MLVLGGHKAPSAKRCIKTYSGRDSPATARDGNKAPSAKRCIKMRHRTMTSPTMRVLKHRAPNGALRQRIVELLRQILNLVIKHRAPNGALRQRVLGHELLCLLSGHKAPSAKRRI